MMTRRLLFGVLGVALVAGSATNARAEGTTCATATNVIPDGRIITSSIPAGATFFLFHNGTVGRSYSFEAKNVNAVFDQDPAGTFAAFSNVGTCTNPIAGIVNTESIDPQFHNASGVRVSYTLATTGAVFSITNNTAGALTYQFSVSETTLFSPAWSTGGTYETYYSFYNTTNAVITGTLTLTKTDGTAGGTPATLVIQPGRTAPTNTVAMGSPEASQGTARFTHNGPPGAILAEADIANFGSTPAYIQPIKFEAVRDKR
jgi:hypothetical protein